jgi:hypothetical protein
MSSKETSIRNKNLNKKSNKNLNKNSSKKSNKSKNSSKKSNKNYKKGKKEYKLMCNLTKKLKTTLVKNPHTIQYFCNIKDIVENPDENKNGFYYDRIFEPPLYTGNILSGEYAEKKYKKKDLPIYLNDIPYLTNYLPKKQKPSTIIHWGQFKLFLTTLQFLTNYVPKNEKTNVLYVGSAPGHNIPLLIDMFPNTYWYLVDPRRFDKRLYEHKRVLYKNNTFFSDKIAHELKEELNKKKFLFISDIRSNEGEEENIRFNNKQQLKWYRILNPDYTFLKLRINRDIENFDYLNGDILLQPFAPMASTESRLIVGKNVGMKTYNLNEYEGRFTLFNLVYRPSYYNHNYNVPNMDHCYDCTLCFHILNKYRDKHKNEYSKMSIIQFIDYIIKSIKTYDKIAKDTENILKNLKL